MGVALAIVSAVAQIGGTIASVASQKSSPPVVDSGPYWAAHEASMEAERASHEATIAQIEEYERQAAQIKEEMGDERSDRVRLADQELAAMQVAAIEGGGLSTINLARLGLALGAAEGRDLDRIARAEKGQLGALHAAAKARAAGHTSYAKQEELRRKQLDYSYRADVRQAQAIATRQRSERKSSMFAAIGSGLSIAAETGADIYSKTRSS